jgi:hypothetical protein
MHNEGAWMAKMMIYVPDDLKAEMDAAKGQQPNWSALAQEAFRLECGRLANRKRSKGKMDAVIERLRKSKEKFSNDEKISGHAAGRAWAQQEASYEELERLAKWEPADYVDDRAWEALVAIAGDADLARDYIDFWKDQAGNETPSEDFVLAFVDGAEEVFNEVADKL